MIGVATMFGPWGLLFGAFAVAGTLKHNNINIQKNKPRKTQKRKNVKKPTTTTKKTKQDLGFDEMYDI